MGNEITAYINTIIPGDCIANLSLIQDESIDMILTAVYQARRYECNNSKEV
jgi:hypothetical protein